MTFNRLHDLPSISRHAVQAMVTLGILAVMAGCSGPGAQADGAGESARPVKTLAISTARHNETRAFPGIVKPARETELTFQVSGPLVEFNVNIGQRVNKEDVIARIDPRDFQIRVIRVTAALDQARANLSAMKSGARSEDIARLEAEKKAAASNLANAQKNFDRQKSLLDERVIAKAQFDNAKTALDTAKADYEVVIQEIKKAKTGARKEEIEAAEANLRILATDLESARNALSDTALIAPFDGYINRKFVETHENIMAGQPVVSLFDLSEVEVKTAVPDTILLRKADITEIYCTLDSFPDRRFPATLKEIGRQTETANQSYPLTVVLHTAGQCFAEPGMAAAVHLILKRESVNAGEIYLPMSALFSDGNGGTCVWRIDPQHMHVSKVPVTTGDLLGDTIRITSGLNDGDMVVAAGARFLREGQKVRILTENTKEPA